MCSTIRTGGAESPKQLLDTLCQFYCGPEGPFQSILILFDEFGRYLEFAVEKPHLAGDAALQQIFSAVNKLSQEYGVLAWDDKFKRYDIFSDATSRNEFLRFVQKKVKAITREDVETLFAKHVDKLDILPPVECGFAARNNIHTQEWQCLHYLSNQVLVAGDIRRALEAWKSALAPNQPKGQIIYCYLSANTKVPAYQKKIRQELQMALRPAGVTAAPILVVLLHDQDEAIRQALSEYDVLTNMDDKEKQKFEAFLKSHEQRLKAELARALTEAVAAVYIEGAWPVKHSPKNLPDAVLNMFETVYSRIIPFPFDGFLTVRGNAARECRDITVELFKGTISHEWFSTKPKPLQNRFKEVLINAWGAINTDGQVRLKPQHEGLAQLIEGFEQALKEQESVNLGDMFHSLIQPPWGFNIASAGLVLGILLCARLDNTALIFKGQQVAAAVWVTRAITKNFIEPEVMRATILQYVETDEWNTLIKQWADAQTCLDQRDFYQQALELEQRIPKPSSDVMNERLKLLKSRGEEAIRELAALDSFIEQQEVYYYQGLDKADVGKLSRTGKAIKDKERECLKKKHLWTAEQIAGLAQKAQKCANSITDFFPSWLPGVSCISYQRLDSFRDAMIKFTCSNLKALNLNPLADQLEKHALAIINDMETRQRISYIVDATRTFLKTTTVTTNIPIVTLAEWMDTSVQHISELERATKIRNVPEIDQHIKLLKQLKEDCQKQENQHWNRHTELMERPFASLEELNTLIMDVRAAIGIFYQQEIELKELNDLLQRLEAYRADFIAWSDPTVSLEQLSIFVSSRIDSISEDPAWEGAEAIYRHIQGLLEDEKARRSTEWLASVQPSRNPAQMSADECHRRLSQVRTLPAFITPQDRKVLADWQQNIEERLEELGINHHVAWFQNQPRRVQGVFVERIVEIYEKHPLHEGETA